MKRQAAHEIDQEAADWAAKVDRGLSTEEESLLEAWLAGDTRRVGAFGIMRATAVETERAAALGPSFEPRLFVTPMPQQVTRRKLLTTASGIAAGIAGVMVAGWAWYERGRYQSRKGEVRQIALNDGSVVTLNTASLVQVSYSKQRRDIHLLRGEALFDVAHDKARPFVVTAGKTEALAVGTSFVVRNLPGQAVQVLVREGVVKVRIAGSSGAAPVTLNADMRSMSAGADASTAQTPNEAPLVASSLQPADVQRALAWRDGRLAFEGETLAQAAAEFARYSDTRIVVDDPSLAKEEIAGLYQSNDPVGFAQSIAASFSAHTDISEGEVRISR